MNLLADVFHKQKDNAEKSPVSWLHSASTRAAMKTYIEVAKSKDAAIADAEAKYQEPIEELQNCP